MTRPGFKIFLRDGLILFLGVMGATWILTPIQAESWVTLVLVALLLAVLNVFLKPILVLFTLPFVIFTFGLGLLLINALLLYLAGQIVTGFVVPDFLTALLGALIISLLNLAVNVILPPRPKINFGWRSNRSVVRRRRTMKRSDVIDV